MKNLHKVERKVSRQAGRGTGKVSGGQVRQRQVRR